MHPYRLFGAAAFAIAAVLYGALSVMSSFDRGIHIATASVFAAIALVWIFTYLRDRSRSSN